MKPRKRGNKNPVAKFMDTVNRPATHKSKVKYNKKRKHKGKGYDLSSSV